MSSTCGRKSRGDLEVTYEKSKSESGITIELDTTMENLYSNNIRKEIIETLKKLNVTDCIIKVIDDGALPYVISSRVEAAVRLNVEVSDER